MPGGRIFALLSLALVASLPLAGQSVVSTHSGIVYFFTGSAYIGNEPLVQKFGRFPDIGEGGELHTTLGRAEVLLTPGVFLRLDENTSIRMLSTSFADTRVELLGGAAILEATEAQKDTSVTLIYRTWRIRPPQRGECRIDTNPEQVRSYEGAVEVLADGRKDGITIKDGEIVPLAAVLVPEAPATGGNDDFARWDMIRSQAIAADNAVSAGIIDDPSQMGGSDPDAAGGGGYSYFPLTTVPYADVSSPYGLSFWSPYQSAFSSIYFTTFFYGPLYPGGRVGRRPTNFPMLPGPLSPRGPGSPIPRAPPTRSLMFRVRPAVHLAPHIAAPAPARR